MNPKSIITELRRINAWRRGDETVGQPAPGHFGDVLDAAAESLAWLKCYGHRTGAAACIGIKVEVGE